LNPLRDPLAGKRQAINDRELMTLIWPLMVDGREQRCPVNRGDVFDMRTCSIEITRTERSRVSGTRVWLALFSRTEKRVDRPTLLSRGTGASYTDDPSQALGLSEDVFHGSALTIDAIEEDERSAAHKNAGEPLEPEAVPPHEIKHYRGSRDAHQRHLLEMGAQRLAIEELPLSERLRRLEDDPRADLSRQFARIRQGVEAAEAKAKRLGEKVPSEHAA
jgi:hypothetical protein